MAKTLIIGATSAIAVATARRFAEQGDALMLVARDEQRLQETADDLRVRGAMLVHTAVLDLLEFERHEGVIDDAFDALNGLDRVLIAHGSLPDQAECQVSFEATKAAFDVNALSVISLLTSLANRFERQGHGSIAVISTVAGDRGRQSNYVYGAAKGAVSLFLEGLRNRLHASGVQVITIKPGFVDTPMTREFKKGPLWASPEQIAKGIDAAFDGKGGNVYLPFYWRYIMLIIKSIPDFIFKRLSL